MYTGLPNPNITVPLEKMKITCQEDGEEISVLYNPQSYRQTRQNMYAQIPLTGGEAPIVQFRSGGCSILEFELFFDSLSAGSEIGGKMMEKAKFIANSLLPSLSNTIDVRDYTGKIYELMHVCESAHRPPLLKVEWSSLQFVGFLESCDQQFTKFDESGTPVRAIMHCRFLEWVDLEKNAGMNPLGSPDTTKFRTIHQGDSLWAMSVKEYGESGQWREIARANGVSNPRRLRAGDTLVVPALLD